jgi:[ribosomal protein S18]-alanine N-acetyltransferase
VARSGGIIRAGEASDIEFLIEMLHEAAYRPGASRPPIETMLADPLIARYIAEWGRPGDAAVIAVDESNHPLGAAWYRLFTVKEAGFGFIDAETPEVSVAVVPDQRGRGIGTALLVALAKKARQQGFAQLSLSVGTENPALRLYERIGFVRVNRSGGHWTMRIDLPRTL